MLVRVRRPIEVDGGVKLHPGDVVDGSGWPNLEVMLRVGYLERAPEGATASSGQSTPATVEATEAPAVAPTRKRARRRKVPAIH